MGPSPQRHLVMEHRASDWVKMQLKTLTAAACHYNHVRIPLSRMFLFFHTMCAFVQLLDHCVIQ